MPIIHAIYDFLIETRAQNKVEKENGFVLQEEVRVRRIIRLDTVLLNARRIVTRRVTFGGNNGLVPSPPSTPRGKDKAVPKLLPLKSILKMPKNAPINVHGRKSVPAPSAARANSPVLPKGYTAKFIVDFVNRTSSPARISDRRQSSPHSNSVPGQSQDLDAIPGPSGISNRHESSRDLDAIPGPSGISNHRQSNQDSDFGHLVYDYDSDSD